MLTTRKSYRFRYLIVSWLVMIQLFILKAMEDASPMIEEHNVRDCGEEISRAATILLNLKVEISSERGIEDAGEKWNRLFKQVEGAIEPMANLLKGFPQQASAVITLTEQSGVRIVKWPHQKWAQALGSSLFFPEEVTELNDTLPSLYGRPYIHYRLAYAARYKNPLAIYHLSRVVENYNEDSEDTDNKLTQIESDFYEEAATYVRPVLPIELVEKIFTYIPFPLVVRVLNKDLNHWFDMHRQQFIIYLEQQEQSIQRARYQLLFMSDYSVYTLKKDSEAILAYLQAKADQGDAWSQYRLGCYYDYGWENIPVNKEYAKILYKKAANQGNPDALYRLGEIYFFGQGDRDKILEKAKSFYEKAMAQGHILAQFKLAENIYHNRFCAAYYDEGKAAELALNAFREAENSNRPEICNEILKALLYWRTDHMNFSFILGEIYNSLGNVGSCYDLKKNIYYYLEAAKAGHPEARKILTNSAQAGDLESQYALARLLENDGKEQKEKEEEKLEEAERLYTGAAEGGKRRAYENLGELAKKRGNIKQAILCFAKVAVDSNPARQELYDIVHHNLFPIPSQITAGDVTLAQYHLGLAFYKLAEKGENPGQNYALALTNLKPVGKSGNRKALFLCGKMNAEGKGVTAMGVNAIKFYNKAVKKDHLKSHYELASLYEMGGTGFSPNLEEARSLRERAKELALKRNKSELVNATSSQEENMDIDDHSIEPPVFETVYSFYMQGLLRCYLSPLMNADFSKNKAKYWFKQGKKAKDGRSTYQLAISTRNRPDRERLDREAVEQGYKKALVDLAYLSTKKEEAFQKYMDAAGNGEPEGYYRMGTMMTKGYKSKDKEPDYYFEQAGNHGMLIAYDAAANWNLKKKQLAKVVEMYQKKANQGDPQAYYELGLLFQSSNSSEESSACIQKAQGFFGGTKADYFENLRKVALIKEWGNK